MKIQPHFEARDDEVYINNSNLAQFESLHYHTKRLGVLPLYWGGPNKGHVLPAAENVYPVFVKRAELRERGITIEGEAGPETLHEYIEPENDLLIAPRPGREDEWIIDSIPIMFATDIHGERTEISLFGRDFPIQTAYMENGFIYDWFTDRASFKRRRGETWERTGPGDNDWRVIREEPETRTARLLRGVREAVRERTPEPIVEGEKTFYIPTRADRVGHGGYSGAAVLTDHWRIELSFVGEGFEGDYDPDDPSDEPVYRLYIQKKIRIAEGLGALFGPEYDDLEGGSYATLIPTTIKKSVVKKVLDYFISWIGPLREDGEVRSVAKQLSWTEIRDDEPYNRLIMRPTMHGPSINALMEEFGIDHGDASSLREAMIELDPPEVMQIANTILHANGVMGLRGERYLGSTWTNTALLYVNRGSRDQTTLIYDVEENRYELDSWGAWADRYTESGRAIGF